MKYVSVLLAVGCLVTAVAQEWQLESVDTSCRPTDVFVKRDSARTYVAYVTGVSTIRIATKDTIWHYETLDTSVVHAGFHFALGPAGRMAVSGLDDSTRPVVVEKSDSVWSRIWTRQQLPYFSPLARAVYSDDTVPTVIYCDGNRYLADVVVETRLDSVWQVDTAWHFDPGSQYCELRLYDADCGLAAGPCFLVQYSYGLPKRAKLPWTYLVYKGFRSGVDWHLVWLDGGRNEYAVGYDIVAGGGDTASAAVYSGGYSLFDRDTVYAGSAMDAAVQIDSAGRDQIAFVASDGVLRFAYKDTRWHYREVPGVTTARCCDLALDDSGQPLIAFEDADGLWLAHGIDVLGAEETTNGKWQVVSGGPTILSVASAVKRLASSLVFDAMGRRVMNPRSGILFVREPSAVTVRKVLAQR